jgi:uncharacterized protein
MHKTLYKIENMKRQIYSNLIKREMNRKSLIPHIVISYHTRITFLLVASFLFYFPSSLFAQTEFTGSWGGDVMIGSTKYPMIFHFHNGAQAETKVLFDMPLQGIHSNQAKISFADDSIRFTIDTFGGYSVYTALYNADAKELQGNILMSGSKFPLQISPVDVSSLKPQRPQTPQRPYSYQEWDVEFSGGSHGVKLSGSITAPKGKKNVPGVVLLSGSGPHNRDAEQFYHKTFLVLADELTRRGFAVLRYDERGVGESTGSYHGTTIYEFSQDANAAVNALRSDPRLKVKNVYIVGHSQGSLEAQVVASQNSVVAGLVLLAGVGLNGIESSKTQYRAQLRASGISEERAKPELILYDNSYEIVGNAPDSATAVTRLREWYKEVGIESENSDSYVAPFVDKWRFDFLHFDPAPYQRKIQVPVLAISGAKDSQVFVEKELEAMRTGLQAGGNSNFESVVMPNVNHFMQTAKEGSYDELYTLEETFSPTGLQKIGDWLEKQSKSKSTKARKGQER